MMEEYSGEGSAGWVSRPPYTPPARPCYVKRDITYLEVALLSISGFYG